MPEAATSLVKDIENVGVVERAVSNQPIVLSDPLQCWIVARGSLDLFLMACQDGEPQGARRPITRISSNEAVFGIPPLSGVVMIASPAPGTVLARVPAETLFRRYMEAHPASVNVVDRWVVELARAVGAGESPKISPTVIDAGEVVKVEEAARSVAPKHDVAWVTHRRGTSAFLGNAAQSINGDGGLFPLARQCWVETSPGSEIYAAGAGEHRTLDPEWQGIQKFGTMVLKILADRYHRAEQLDRDRLQARAQSDNALLNRTMLRLASTIQKVREVSEGGHGCNHPVFLVAQAIATRMGFKVQPHPDMLRGLEVKDPVAAVARASNVRVRRVTLKGAWWKSEAGCLLAFEEETNHALAILPRGRGFEVYDPSDQSYTKLTPARAEKINPSAYVLYRPFPSTKLTPRELLRFALTDTRQGFALVLGSGLAIGLLGLLTPYATGIVFDQFIPGAERGSLAQMCVFLAVASIASAMLTVTRGFAVLRLQGKMDAVVQAAVWDRLLSLPVSFFRNYSSGDLAQRSMGIAKIREVLTGTTLTAFLSGIFSISSFALLFYYSWRLALVATALVAFACTISTICGLIRLRKQRSMIYLEGKISSTLLQFITGIAKFRVSATERRAFAAWGRQFATLKGTSTEARRVSAVMVVFSAAFPVFCSMLFFLSYDAFPSLASGLTTGELVAFLAAFTQFLQSVLSLSTASVNALGIVPLYERAVPVLEAAPEVTEAKTAPGRLSGGIELSHITFRYKADMPLILRDISLKIRPGEFVAFVGASGSGKSTLLRLLLGFEQPESGAVYFDGQDLAGLDIQAVRRQIGVVLQTSKPVSGSIFENIVGSAPLTVDDAWTAACAAGFDQDVRRMPMGLHTHISDGGGGISGGQRQRLLIARAIVARPRMLFFDEATSALDNRTQEIVTKSLDALQATRVVIAHRLSTIMNADRIFVLDKGTLVQSGTYSQLVAVEGLFKTLAERQTV
jgi:NHLM bacteriocin system ABC transporter ATP-binding protein